MDREDLRKKLTAYMQVAIDDRLRTYSNDVPGWVFDLKFKMGVIDIKIDFLINLLLDKEGDHGNLGKD